MTPLAATPAALREAATGTPCLLVLAGVADPAALALPGLAAWQVTPGPDGTLRLHGPGEDPAGATLPLPALPAAVLAVVAPDTPPPLAARLAALLADLPGAACIRAADAAAALPGIAAAATAALAARAAEAGDLHRALATLREEAEATREAMAALVRGVGHRPPPPPVLALAAEPGAEGIEAPAGDAPLRLAQRLGTTLEGLAALGLCLAEAAVAAPGARLRIRLSGAESGRVRGAWTLAGPDLAPGWLVLDLPTPLGPQRETACLDLAVEGLGPGDRLRLALEDREAPPDRAAVGADGIPAVAGRALALRLWIAPFGRRFVLAPHWDWEAPDRPLGLPIRLPEPLWAAARALPAGRGSDGLVGLGEDGPARPILALAPGERALLLLPAVPVAGLDLLEAEVALRLGDGAGIEAALWTQPEGTPIAGEADLSLSAPRGGARTTGWLPIEPAGGGLTLALRLPVGGPGLVAVALALRHGGADGTPAGGTPARIEWADLRGRALAPPLPAPPEGARLPPSPSLAAAAPADAVPVFAAVRLNELFAMEGGAYRHLDIGVEGLRLGALAWPRLRFKFALDGEAPRIEIRARPDWPVVFERWPGRQADAHGPFLLLTEADRGGRARERLASERDRRLLGALLALLPALVATAARAATASPAEYEAWVGMARRFAAAVGGEAAGGG